MEELTKWKVVFVTPEGLESILISLEQEGYMIALMVHTPPAMTTGTFTVVGRLPDPPVNQEVLSIPFLRPRPRSGPGGGGPKIGLA